MKILWLYRYAERWNADHWLHMDFAKAISKHNEIKLMAYGHNLEKKYSDLAPIPYNAGILIADLKREFDFDVIILNTKSRMFLNYLPPLSGDYPYKDVEIRENCWLPKDFANWDKTPKIAIEEDYHWEKNDYWYIQMGIKCILQRHYSQSLRQQQVKMIWFPFSVDTDVFKPDTEINKINKICFVGNNDPGYYPHRHRISNILNALDLLVIEGNLGNKKYDNDYITCLQSYVSHLSSSSRVDITSAKMFEIMSSGSLLFTNNSKNYGLQKLFPSDTYCTYKEDYSDLIEKTNKILFDKDYVKSTTEKAIQCIKEKHTHQIRIGELLNILKGIS